MEVNVSEEQKQSWKALQKLETRLTFVLVMKICVVKILSPSQNHKCIEWQKLMKMVHDWQSKWGESNCSQLESWSRILRMPAGLAMKALPFQAKTVLPTLATGALSGIASTVQKARGNGLYLKKGGNVFQVETDEKCLSHGLFSEKVLAIWEIYYKIKRWTNL